jgi:6-phosphofructokinase 2
MATQHPVATLSLNPTVDIAYRVKQLVSGVMLDSTKARHDPGGNGINVARGLKRLGIEAYACTVLAGTSGAMLRFLLKDEIDHLEAIDVPGETSINSTIKQLRPPEEFKIRGIGPDLSDEMLKRVCDNFLKHSKGGFGVLTGKLPPNLPYDVYRTLAEKLYEQGTKTFIDAKSKTLAEAIQAHPYFIKPNLYEFELVCGKSLNSLEAIANEARKLQQKGVENVCVSLGADGALLVTKDNSYYGTAPKIRVRCSTGAGDSMMSGFLAATIEGKSSEDVLRLGLACGAGTTTVPGTMLFDPKSIQKYFNEQEITVLDI